jgi:hypothetical protein
MTPVDQANNKRIIRSANGCTALGASKVTEFAILPSLIAQRAVTAMSLHGAYRPSGGRVLGHERANSMANRGMAMLPTVMAVAPMPLLIAVREGPDRAFGLGRKTDVTACRSVPINTTL